MGSIRIVYPGGGPKNIKVFDSESGVELQGIRRIDISPITTEDIVIAKLEFVNVQLDLEVTSLGGEYRRFLKEYVDAEGEGQNLGEDDAQGS